jgi:HD-like signal output (HDOD) protein
MTLTDSLKLGIIVVTNVVSDKCELLEMHAALQSSNVNNIFINTLKLCYVFT